MLLCFPINCNLEVINKHQKHLLEVFFNADSVIGLGNSAVVMDSKGYSGNNFPSTSTAKASSECVPFRSPIKSLWIPHWQAENIQWNSTGFDCCLVSKYTRHEKVVLMYLLIHFHVKTIMDKMSQMTA